MSLKPPIPREHGSWAMLIVPLLLGTVVAPAWHWRTLILLVATLAFFLVRFPLATLVKSRQRARADRRSSWRWVAVYGLITALCGAWLVFAARLHWLAPMGAVGAGLLLFHLWLVARRQEMRAVGQLAGIFGLALGAPMAYYTGGGQLDRTAAALWLFNALYFGGTVFYIKLKVRRQARQPAPDRISERLVAAKACLTYQAIALAIVLLLVAWQQAPVLIPLAFVPATLKVLHGARQWQDRHSLSLIRLGVTEIVHAVVFTILVIFAFSQE